MAGDILVDGVPVGTVDDGSGNTTRAVNVNIPAGAGGGQVSPVPATAVNTPAILTSAGGLAANASRKGWSIQNLGTNPLFVRLAASASSTVFHFVLKGGSVADDGNGGIVSGDGTHKGVINATGTSPRFVVLELS